LRVGAGPESRRVACWPLARVAAMFDRRPWPGRSALVVLALTMAGGAAGIRESAGRSSGGLPGLLRMIDFGAASCSVYGLQGEERFAYRANNDWLGRISEETRLDGEPLVTVKWHTLQVKRPPVAPSEFVRHLKGLINRHNGCQRMAFQQAGHLVGLALLASMADPSNCTWRRGVVGGSELGLVATGQTTGFTSRVDMELSTGDHISIEWLHERGQMPWIARTKLSCEDIFGKLYSTGLKLLPVGRPDWQAQVGFAIDEAAGMKLLREFSRLVNSANRIGRVGMEIVDFRAELMHSETLLDAALFASTELFRITSEIPVNLDTGFFVAQTKAHHK